MYKYKSVDEFLASLDSDRKAQVLKLRECIASTGVDLREHIKWNAPSYVFKDEDRITFNTSNKEQVVRLVFHMGVKRKENKKGKPLLKNVELIEWVSDIRGYATFRSLEDINKNENGIKQVIKDWLALN